MSTQEKNPVVGDVVKYESPHTVMRESRHVTMVPAATLPLVCGEMMEPDTNVAQIETYTAPTVVDGGTYRLGYEGAWTAPLAQAMGVADMKTAFDALPTVLATGHTITFAVTATLLDTMTATWSAVGHKSAIQIDARLLTDGGVVQEGLVSFAITTPGSLITDMVIVATGGNTTGVLLEEVSLVDLQTKDNIERSFLIAGDGGYAIVDGDRLYAIAAQLATGIAAIDALAGIHVRYEPNILSSGTPEDSLP